MLKKPNLKFVLTISLITANMAWASNGEDIAFNGLKDAAVPACTTCHGDHGAGNSTTGVPRLAGQGNAYLQKQLMDFKNGRRTNEIMVSISSALTNEQIADVAIYFSSLPGPKPNNNLQNNEHLLGARLAEEGNWEKDVPACFRCHGDDGLGVAPYMPAITGQPPIYIANQLKAWRLGARANDPVGVMGAVAGRLSDTEIDAIAEYLAAIASAAP